MKTFTIKMRKRVEVNTDPQRRCYNGCHAKSEMRWSGWEVLEIRVKEDEVEERLKFWRELNDYAVESRGEGARKEFTATESDVQEEINHDNTRTN